MRHISVDVYHTKSSNILTAETSSVLFLIYFEIIIILIKDKINILRRTYVTFVTAVKEHTYMLKIMTI